MLEELIQKIRQGDIKSFEDFYILTYDTLYSYAWILTGAQKEQAKGMLIRSYCMVYGQRENIPEETQVYEWLYHTMEQIAIDWLEMTEEQIQDIKKEEENHETAVKLSEETAASILLSVEELLGLMEEPEESFDRKKKLLFLAKFCFACGCLAFAVFAVCNGVEKIKDQLNLLKQPLIKTLPSVVSPDDPNGSLDTDAQTDDNWIKVSDKIYFLSDIGEVLYSLPLLESEWRDKNPYNDEIQETEEWVYYLPSPKRSNSKLSNVSTRLYQTLYRMKKQDQTMEIIAEEVEDYTLYQNSIYVMQYGRIHKLDEVDSYEVLEDSLFAEAKEDGIHLYHVLGNQLLTNADGILQIEDRNYKMRGNRIESVAAAECRKDDTVWYLKTEGNTVLPELYQMESGVESVFETQGIRINSFCMVKEWIYYSAYMRDAGGGAQFSQIYRKPIAGGATELVHNDFSGIMKQMYYHEENDTIYGEYQAKSWANGYGQIAVIAADGSMSTLNDPTERSAEETTGHDNLSFVIVQDDMVLCYWNNCSWIKGEEPFIIWSKPLVLANQSRTPIPEVIHQTRQ